MSLKVIGAVLYLALLVCVESHVIRDSHVSFIEHDTFGIGLEGTESVRFERAAPVAPGVIAFTPKPKDPVVELRASIKGGANNCPTGYKKQGTFCFPDVDY